MKLIRQGGQVYGRSLYIPLRSDETSRRTKRKSWKPTFISHYVQMKRSARMEGEWSKPLYIPLRSDETKQSAAPR